MRAMGRVGKGVRELFTAPWLMFVTHLPGPLGQRLRYRYWRRRLGGLGENVRIDEGVRFVNPQSIFIGSNCWLGFDAYIGAGPPSTFDRDLVRRPNPDYEHAEGEVHIGSDVYIAPSARINGHGGVQIGDNVSVGGFGVLLSLSHYYRGPSDPRGLASVAAGIRRTATDSVGRQSALIGPVVLRSESFVGVSAVVLPGVTIGPATWLGASAVATRSLQPNRVYTAPAPELIEERKPPKPQDEGVRELS